MKVLDKLFLVGILGQTLGFAAALLYDRSQMFLWIVVGLGWWIAFQLVIPRVVEAEGDG